MKILICQTSFLGDVVLTTPLMEPLRSRYPEARFTWITTPQAAPLLRHDPWIDEVHTLEKRGLGISIRSFFAVRAALRERTFDLAYGVQRAPRTAVLLASAGVRPRHGFRESHLGWLYHQRAGFPRLRSEHEVLRNLALIDERKPFPLRIVSPPSLLSDLPAGAPAPEKSVVLGVGSAWATKRWTVGGFIDVARWVAKQGLVPVLLGSGEDRARAELVAEQVSEAIVAQYPLDQAAAFVSQARAVVAHDSLLLHLASAHKRPTVAIFCSTVPEFGFGPWMNPCAVTLGVDGLPCRPCGRHGHQRCPTGTWACSLELSSARVIESLNRVMNGSGRV